MGIYSRDYLRESTPRFSSGGDGSVCKKLIIVTVVVFLAQFLFTTTETVQIFPGEYRQFKVSVVTSWLQLDPQDTIHGQIWRLVTYAFCHARDNILHIVFNMLLLWWFGKTLEIMYGSREFLLFYLTAAAFAGVCFIALALRVGNQSPAIGASGAVMAVMMVFAMHYPRQVIYIFGILPLEMRWVVVLYVFYDVFPVIRQLGGQQPLDNVAHSAHVGGLLFGYLYKKYNIRLESLFSNFRRNQLRRVGSSRKIRLYRPTDDVGEKANMESQVDAILSKIHEQGEASLTDSERNILNEASRRYRDR